MTTLSPSTNLHSCPPRTRWLRVVAIGAMAIGCWEFARWSIDAVPSYQCRFAFENMSSEKIRFVLIDPLWPGGAQSRIAPPEHISRLVFPLGGDTLPASGNIYQLLALDGYGRVLWRDSPEFQQLEKLESIVALGTGDSVSINPKYTRGEGGKP